MHFTKMHGIGNDYVYVDCFTQQVADPAELAPRICDRHFGVGADGLILILPAKGNELHARMRIFNADGSEAQMCGNGIRCVAKYVHDHGISKANPLRIATAAGIKAIELVLDKAGNAVAATVDMGQPVLAAAEVPVNIPRQRVIDAPLSAGRHHFQMTCVSMGNPHAVMFADEVASLPLEEVGPAVERSPLFPQRVNAHFVQVVSPAEVTMRTWERGSGITLGCGTGAAAVCVAGVLTGRSERKILAHLPGGDLDLEWRQDDDHVYLTGPAEEVFSGDWPEDDATEQARPAS